MSGLRSGAVLPFGWYSLRHDALIRATSVWARFPKISQLRDLARQMCLLGLRSRVGGIDCDALSIYQIP